MNTTNSFLTPIVQTMPPSGIRQFFNAAEADPEVISWESASRILLPRSVPLRRAPGRWRADGPCIRRMRG